MNQTTREQEHPNNDKVPSTQQQNTQLRENLLSLTTGDHSFSSSSQANDKLVPFRDCFHWFIVLMNLKYGCQLSTLHAWAGEVK